MENQEKDIWKSSKFRRPREKAHELPTQTIHKVSDSSDNGCSSLRIPPWSQIQLKQSRDCKIPDSFKHFISKYPGKSTMNTIEGS